jgi:hypothetical protein
MYQLLEHLRQVGGTGLIIQLDREEVLVSADAYNSFLNRRF